MTEAEGLRILRRRLPRAVGRGLGTLHRIHRRLWDLEDRVRATETGTTIARLEREIDRAQLARATTIKAIDAAVVARYKRGAEPHDRGAVLDSASLGRQIDRLAILAIKRGRVVGPTAHALAAEHWDHAIACLDRALAALAAGRWVHHPPAVVKQFGVTRPVGRAATSRARAGRRSRPAGPRVG